MPDQPLPRLTPDNPENRLSIDARQRVSRALVEFDLIRKRARSAIELHGYWGTPQASIDMREADMEAARTVLQAEAEEYGKLGLPALEFRETIRQRIEGMVYSLEFSSLQRDALEAEFVWYTSRDTEVRAIEALQDMGPEADQQKPAAGSRSITNISAAARVTQHLAEHALTQVVFAEKTGIGERTVGHLLRTGSATKGVWILVARAIGVTFEDLLGTGK